MAKLIANSEYAFSLQELIDGDCWYADELFPAAAGTQKAMWLETGAQGVLFRAFVSTSAENVKIDIYEDGAVTGGTPITEFNFNRRSSATTAVTCQRDGTAAPFGDNILTTGMTTGRSPNPVIELYLKPNTMYCLNAKNEGAGVTLIYTRFCWCE